MAKPEGTAPDKIVKRHIGYVIEPYTEILTNRIASGFNLAIAMAEKDHSGDEEYLEALAEDILVSKESLIEICNLFCGWVVDQGRVAFELASEKVS